MNKRPIRPGILTHFDRSKFHIDYKNAVAIDIGGDQWNASASLMESAGAAHVTSINITPNWPERLQLTPVIEKKKIDATRLAVHFEPQSVDICYGIAVLEHIPDTWKMLESIKAILKPGGLLYLHGGPIWSSAKGHHLFTKVNGKAFKFSDRDCPIQNWEHLTCDADELTDRIISRGIDKNSAIHLANWIFTTDEQNRYSFKQLCGYFDESGLETIQRYDNSFAGPSPDQYNQLAAFGWSPEDRLDVMGTTFVAKKPG